MSGPLLFLRDNAFIECNLRMCSEVKPKGKRDDSFFSLSSLFAWFKIKGYFEGAFCGLLCVYFVFHAYQQNKSYVSIWLSFIFSLVCLPLVN